MDTTKNIRLLVVLEIITTLIYLFLTFYLESQLPDLLQQYLLQEKESEFNNTDIITAIIGVPFLICYFTSITGLLFVKTWAKNLYIFTVIAGYLSAPLLGPSIEHAISAAVYDVTTIIEGAILALLLFTKSAFNKSSQQDASCLRRYGSLRARI